MQIVATSCRLDRAAFWRLRQRQYTVFLWIACVAGPLLAIGSIARILGVDSEFVMSAWGHLFLIVLPLVLLLVAAAFTLITVEAGMPARPILLRAHKPRTPPVPAAFWPASAFERPPRCALVA